MSEYVHHGDDIRFFIEAGEASSSGTNSTIIDPGTGNSTGEDPVSTPVYSKEVKQIGSSTKTVKLSWDKVLEANGYYVYVKSGSKWKKVATFTFRKK